MLSLSLCRIKVSRWSFVPLSALLSGSPDCPHPPSVSRFSAAISAVQRGPWELPPDRWWLSKRSNATPHTVHSAVSIGVEGLEPSAPNVFLEWWLWFCERKKTLVNRVGFKDLWGSFKHFGGVWKAGFDHAWTHHQMPRKGWIRPCWGGVSTQILFLHT